VSAVIEIEECPSRLLTNARSIPAASISDALPCRRSCSRTRRTPAAGHSSPNRFVKLDIRRGVERDELLTPGRVERGVPDELIDLHPQVLGPLLLRVAGHQDGRDLDVLG